MIASLVAPILWLGALERFRRWQTNRNGLAGSGLLTALALALMVTLDTPAVTNLVIAGGLSFHQALTVQRILLLVACVGAVVFALALEGTAPRSRVVRRVAPLLLAIVVVVVNSFLVRGMVAWDRRLLALAIETGLAYGALTLTAISVSAASWRASRRTQKHRPQLLVLALGGALLAAIAIANVVAGGVLLNQVNVGVWVLRINRLLLGFGFAGWALVLMASWAGTVLIATREWLKFRTAYEQIADVFPDLEAVTVPGDWVETVESRAGLLLDGWALIARPGEGELTGAPISDRVAAVSAWLDRSADYGSISAGDLAPPPGWRTARWVAAVAGQARTAPPMLVERVR